MLLLNFLNHYKEPLYKDMRRGKFSPRHIKEYEEILDLVVLNMQALGQSQEEVDAQIILFWFSITEKADCPGEFLSGLQLIYASDEIQEITRKKYIPPDLECFYFIDHKIKEEFEFFQRNWRERIKMILEWRRDDERICSQFDDEPLEPLKTALIDCPDVPRKLAQSKKLPELEREWLRKSRDTDWLDISAQIPLSLNIPKASSPRELYERACDIQGKRMLDRKTHRRKIYSRRRFNR